MYWNSGPELYIFICDRLKSPDTKHQTQQSVLLSCTENLIRRAIDGRAHYALVRSVKPFHSAYSNYASKHLCAPHPLIRQTSAFENL